MLGQGPGAPTQCDEGYTCPPNTRGGADTGRADDHGCVPILCSDGYTCPSNSACLPTAAQPDGHGCAVVTCDGVSFAANQICQLTYGVSAVCVAKTCKSDSDCDCGVCINATLSASGNCAPRMSVRVAGQGGAQGSAGGIYGGGAGVTGAGCGVIDSGMGGAGGSIDSGAGG